MSPEEIINYLEQKIDLLQRKVVELTEHRDEIDRQLRNHKELIRYYRGVFEAEQEVGIQNQVTVASNDETMEELITKVVQDSESKQPAQHIIPRNKNIRWAMNQILESASEPLNAMRLCQLITERYPDIADRSKNLFHTVEAQLWRGRRQNIYEWVDKGLYRLKRNE